MIVIVDYNSSNVGSVKKAIKHAGYNAVISGDPAIIGKADRLILPGVGTFGNAMNVLKNKNLLDLLERKVCKESTPVLGICLGAQLMTQFSDENSNIPGLAWINAKTVKFKEASIQNKFKLPNFGWLNLIKTGNDKMFFNIDDDAKFYFAHSYHFEIEDQAIINSTATYSYSFPTSFILNNIWGTQFHPEKSHDNGIQLVKNFVAYA